MRSFKKPQRHFDFSGIPEYIFKLKVKTCNHFLFQQRKLPGLTYSISTLSLYNMIPNLHGGTIILCVENFYIFLCIVQNKHLVTHDKHTHTMMLLSLNKHILTCWFSKHCMHHMKWVMFARTFLWIQDTKANPRNTWCRTRNKSWVRA